MSLGRSEGDAFFATLGARRIPIPIPFKQAGGPINVYLLDNPDGSLTLFDTGLVTDEATAALEQGFAEAGRRVEDVTRVLVSHGHVDHYGLARRVQQRTGAKVYLHRADWNKVLVGRALPPMDDYLVRLGVPGPLIAQIASMHGRTEAFGERLDALEPLEDGQVLAFARFEGRIVHFPGHTPGLVCLHVPEARAIFTDDHLLARVSPNPLLELGERGEADKFQSLVSYLASARRLHALELDWLAPGHGEPFQGHRAVLDSLFAFYERRQARILATLAERPRTAFELVVDVFGDAGALQLFLMLSEIVGNLEVLEGQGRLVTDRTAAGPYQYRAA